jgi:hypothetical protein
VPSTAFARADAFAAWCGGFVGGGWQGSGWRGGFGVWQGGWGGWRGGGWGLGAAGLGLGLAATAIGAGIAGGYPDLVDIPMMCTDIRDTGDIRSAPTLLHRMTDPRPLG